MIRYLLGFTIGALLTVTVLLLAAPRPVPAPAPAPLDGWYNPALVQHYT
jgi:hypothetical protein